MEMPPRELPQVEPQVANNDGWLFSARLGVVFQRVVDWLEKAQPFGE